MTAQKTRIAATLSVAGLLATTLTACSVLPGNSQLNKLEDIATEQASASSGYAVAKYGEPTTFTVEAQQGLLESTLMELAYDQGVPENIRTWEPEVTILADNARIEGDGKYLCMDFSASNNVPELTPYKSENDSWLTAFMMPTFEWGQSGVSAGHLEQYVDQDEQDTNFRLQSMNFVEMGIDGLNYSTTEPLLTNEDQNDTPINYSTLEPTVSGGWNEVTQERSDNWEESQMIQAMPLGGQVDFSTCWANATPFSDFAGVKGEQSMPEEFQGGAYSVTVGVGLMDSVEHVVVPFAMVDGKGR